MERKYQTLYNRLRATLNESTLDSKNKGKLWGECAFCVTNLENICVDEPNKKSPYEIFYGRKCNIVNELRKFGEIGVVKVEYDGMVSKLKNKGKSMMMCGYSLNHSKGFYIIYDLNKENICISRDIKWLGLMYNDWKLNRNDIKDQERDNTPLNNELMEYNRVYKPSEELEDDNESVDSFEKNRLMRS